MDDKINPIEINSMMINKTPIMSNLIHEQIKDDVYTIGFTAYEGKYGTNLTDVKKAYNVVLPPKNSIEYQLANNNYEQAFVSLSNISTEKFWNSDPVIRLFDYKSNSTSNNWNEIIDAVIYIKTMKPSTRK